MLLKYKEIRKRQVQSENDAISDDKADETLTDVINAIKEEYFSDLQPEDIPDDHVEEVSENDIDLSSLADVGDYQELETKLMVETQM